MPDPVLDINSFRNAIRGNQGETSENSVVTVGAGGTKALVKNENFFQRSFRRIHQTQSDKLANREARQVFWDAVSSAYTRRDERIPDSLWCALSEEGISLSSEEFIGSDKPLSARTVERVLAVIDLDLNLIEKAHEEVTRLQEQVAILKDELKNKAFGLPPSGYDTQHEFVGVFDEAVRAKDFRGLYDTGAIETKRQALQEEEKKYEKLSEEPEHRDEALEKLEGCRAKLAMLEEFVKAGRAYDEVVLEIHRPLFTAVSEYQNMLKEYNNTAYSARRKSEAMSFQGDSKENHYWLRNKPSLNLMDVFWKVNMSPNPSAREINALKPAYRAALLYTMGSGYMNAPLSGFSGRHFGTPFVGVGNTSWEVPFTTEDGDMIRSENGESKDVGTAREHIPALTEEINKHYNDEDFVLYRGADLNFLAGVLKTTPEELTKLSPEEFDTMLLKEGYFPAFTSTSHSEETSQGFMPMALGKAPRPAVQMRIFCPKGTKMLYCQPFTYFADDTEYELLLQRGAHFRVSHFEKTVRQCEDGGKQDLYILEMEIHPERGYVMVKENPA